jgi:phospholipase D1/2
MKPKVGPQDFEDPISDDFWKDIWVASAIHNTEIYRKVFHAVPDDLITTWKQYKDFVAYQERFNKPTRDSSPAEPISQNASESGEERAAPESQPAEPHNMNSELSKDGRENALTDLPLQDVPIGTAQNEELHSSRRFSKNSEPFEKWEREEMENLLSQLNGQLVVYPNHFLEGENSANNFLFNADRLLPLPIYL